LPQKSRSSAVSFAVPVGSCRCHPPSPVSYSLPCCSLPTKCLHWFVISSSCLCSSRTPSLTPSTLLSFPMSSVTTGLTAASVRSPFLSYSCRFWCSSVMAELPTPSSCQWFHTSVVDEQEITAPSIAFGHSDHTPVCTGHAPRTLWTRSGHA
jgi:hypothetical protein